MTARFKAGTTYELTVTLSVLFTPEQDCTEADLEEQADELINEGEYSIDDVNYNSSEVEEEDDHPELAEAQECWDELVAGEDPETHPRELSTDQLQFIYDAMDAGLEVEAYSGRNMFGKRCPGVRVDHAAAIKTRIRYEQDSMGMGLILYATK